MSAPAASIASYSAKPHFLLSALLGFQHLLAVFGGIVTAPLIVALAMQLPPTDTAYLISSSLVISGVATTLQIQRFGMIGSGLLSIQGTSFTFIGPLIYCYFWLLDNHSSSEALGLLFGSSAVCSMIVFCLSPFVRRIARLITTNVTGATVILIGATLVWTTLKNIWGLMTDAEVSLASTLIMFVVPFSIIIALSTSKILWARMSSVAIGLLCGYALAALMGWVDYSSLHDLPPLFLPELGRYPIGVDWIVVAILLPIFVVSLMESVGDFTVTSLLSGLSIGDASYWQRVRGGLMADSFNSFMASLFSTFPNTTFSQNNGVIRLTGNASPYVGRFTAAMLLILGLSPLVAGVFQSMPAAVLYGATLLMFVMVAYAGSRIVLVGGASGRDILVVVIAIVGGYGLAFNIDQLTWLPQPVQMTLQFPASTGAIVAIFAELLVPRSVLKTTLA